MVRTVCISFFGVGKPDGTGEVGILLCVEHIVDVN